MPEIKEKLVIIDGNSLVNRAYYAIQRPMMTKDGIYTQGIYGFLSMLTKIRSDYAPTHMLVAFDRKAPTFRHLEYKEYKAGRKKMPDELAMELPILKEVLAAMGISMFEIDGYEADDIIGTTARMADEAGLSCFVITGDKDALQLATDNTSVIITKKGISEFKLYDDAAMMEEFGFDHLQFIDYKALRGDSSDNIPGIPGVGDKTARQLICQFGSIDNMIANSDEISNAKLREKVQDYAMQTMMSKRLATIVTSVPVDYEIDDLRIRPENTDSLIDLYTQLEFKTYLSRLLKNRSVNAVSDDSSEDPENKISFDFPDIEVLRDKSEVLDLFKDAEECLIDIKTDQNHKDMPFVEYAELMISGRVYVVELENVLSVLKECFDRKKIRLSGFNLGKLYYALLCSGCNIDGIETAFDAAVAAYVLSPSSSDPNLEALLISEFHQGYAAVAQQSQMDMFSAADYSESSKKMILLDALIKEQKKKIEKEELDFVLYQIELPLCKVLSSMEYEGIRLKADSLRSFGDALDIEIKRLEQEIIDLAGESFNINSPKQLGDILFDKLGLPPSKKTQKGYSTSADVLEKLAPDYPIVAYVLEYRTLSKLKSTYVEGMLNLIGSDGKIHCHFNQTVTATGRISCTEPNLQNIPVRKEPGRSLRKSFVADKDHILIGADYSQIELRILAHMSKDPDLIECFNRGLDIHRETAAKVFGVPEEEVTSEMRSAAKAVNFGVIYGMSGFGLASELTISRKQAEQYIADYFGRFPMVKQFMNECVARCKIEGYSLTMFGRKRNVPEITASAYMVRQLGERLAMNTPIQGSAADIIKIAMIKVYEALKTECPRSSLILQIHDELIINAHVEEQEKVCRILEECMQNAAQLLVKLEVSMEKSETWYEL